MASADIPESSGAFPSSVREMAELGALYETHWSRLIAIMRHRVDPALGVRLDAEDIVNAAFLDARRRWTVYRADPKVSEFVWLYRLATDRLIEEWRRATSQKVNIQRNVPWPSHASFDLGLRLVAPETGPEQKAIRNEIVSSMQKALQELREDDRDVIMMRSYEDLSFREIGELLGISENAATVRHMRALRKLKDHWKRLTGESRP